MQQTRVEPRLASVHWVRCYVTLFVKHESAHELWSLGAYGYNTIYSIFVNAREVLDSNMTRLSTGQREIGPLICCSREPDMTLSWTPLLHSLQSWWWQWGQAVDRPRTDGPRVAESSEDRYLRSLHLRKRFLTDGISINCLRTCQTFHSIQTTASAIIPKQEG